jgi:DNA-binding transcriptional MerR regulator
MPLTVTNLARACKLSRSTLLYYESIGLLPRPRRTAGNYRAYAPKDVERLRQICVYRDAGVPLADIRAMARPPCCGGGWRNSGPRWNAYGASSAPSPVYSQAHTN